MLCIQYNSWKLLSTDVKFCRRHLSSMSINIHKLTISHTHFIKLIPFKDDIDMQTNPYITITGNVSHFDTDDRSFTISPSQYIILTHTTAPFPIHTHFADTNLKKKVGTGWSESCCWMFNNFRRLITTNH